MMELSSSGRIFSSSEVATYIVCPEAWRLKVIGEKGQNISPRAQEVKELRKEWFKNQELSSQLRFYAKIVFFLLLLIVVTLFIIEAKVGSNNSEENRLKMTLLSRIPSQLPNELLGLLIVFGVALIIWDFFEKKRTKIQKDTGLDNKIKMVALQGSNFLPSRTFSSETLGLVSIPDALIEEAGILIPIDIKPISKKIQDRHIIEMTVHLRLIEEATGKVPPYGILLMGQEKRRVEIKNTAERQRHLETLIDEMRSILDGVPAIPRPAYYKCRNCDVHKICSSSAFHEQKTEE